MEGLWALPQLCELLPPLLEKPPADSLHVRQVHSHQLSPVLRVEAPERPVLLLSDDLDLSLDDKSVRDREAIKHLAELHELLPAPVMLLLAEPVKGIRILALLWVLVHHSDSELSKV